MTDFNFQIGDQVLCNGLPFTVRANWENRSGNWYEIESERGIFEVCEDDLEARDD